MAFNPNYIPWMTILGVLGGAIGFVIGGATFPAGQVPALYGLCIGSAGGILVRIVLRARTGKQKEPEKPAG